MTENYKRTNFQLILRVLYEVVSIILRIFALHNMTKHSTFYKHFVFINCTRRYNAHTKSGNQTKLSDDYLCYINLIDMNKTTPKNMVIRRLPYTRMLKSEMANYAENIMSIVESHHPDSAIINPLLEVLLAKKPKIEKLRLSYGVDVDRLKIDKLKRQMMLTISIFKLNVKMLSSSNEELDMHVLQNAINKHLCYLNRCRNDKELNQKIAGFLDLMDSNTKLVAVLDEFDLLDDANKIKSAHNLLNDAVNKRVNKLSKRPNISTKQIIKDLFDAIDNLFKGLEVAQVINSITVTEADFAPLISELSQLSDMYYNSFSIRKANNKRKLEKEQQSDSVIKKVVDNEIVDESENIYQETVTLEETTVEEPTTAIISISNNDKKENPLQEYEASIKELDVALGKAPAIPPEGGNLLLCACSLPNTKWFNVNSNGLQARDVVHQKNSKI